MIEEINKAWDKTEKSFNRGLVAWFIFVFLNLIRITVTPEGSGALSAYVCMLTIIIGEFVCFMPYVINDHKYDKLVRKYIQK